MDATQGAAAPDHQSQLDVTSAQKYHGDLETKQIATNDQANSLKNQFPICSQSVPP